MPTPEPHAERPSVHPLLPYLNVLTLFGLAVAQPLLDLLGAHPELFVIRRLGASHILGMLVVLYLVLPIPLVAAMAVSGRLGRRVRAWSERGLMWSLLVLILLRVCKLYGPGLGRLDLLIAGAGAGLAVWLLSRFEAARLFLAFFSISLVVTPLSFLLKPKISEIVLGRNEVDIPFHETGSDTPVFFIILDELPTSTLIDADGELNAHRYPSLARLASTGTWFENAVSISDATHLAIPSILTGLAPSNGKLPKLAHYPQNLFTLFGDYSLVAHEPITHLCPDERNLLPALGVGEHPFQELVFDFPLFYGHLILPELYAKRLPDITGNWRGFRDGSRRGSESGSAGTFDRIEDFVYAAADEIKADREHVFDRFLQQIQGDRPKTLYFGHFLLPHGPWIYLADGERVQAGHEHAPGLVKGRWQGHPWHGIQALKRHIFQTQFTDRLIGRMLNRIEEAGLYEQSLIVILSDHGVSFRPGVDYRKLEPENAPDVLPSLLLIKKPFQTEPERVARPVTLSDTLATVLDVLGIEAPEGVGRSAFSPDYADDFPYQAFSGTKGDFPYDDTLFERMRERARWKIELFGDGSDERSIYGAGSRPELHGRSPSEVGISERMPMAIRINDERVYRDLKPTEVAAFSRITGEIETGEPGCLSVAVAVNGRIEATTRTHDSGSGCGSFGAYVPPSSLRPGANDVRIYGIEQAGQVVLHRAGSTVGDVVFRRSPQGRPTALVLDGRRVRLSPKGFQGRLAHFESRSESAELHGWAIDQDAGTTPGEVLLFLGERLVAGARIFGDEPTAAEHYGEQYLRSRFVFELGDPEVAGARRQGLTAIVVSRDRRRASLVRAKYSLEADDSVIRGSDGLLATVQCCERRGRMIDVRSENGHWLVTVELDSRDPPRVLMVFSDESYLSSKYPGFAATGKDGEGGALRAEIRIAAKYGLEKSLAPLKLFALWPDGVGVRLEPDGIGVRVAP